MKKSELREYRGSIELVGWDHCPERFIARGHDGTMVLLTISNDLYYWRGFRKTIADCGSMVLRF